MKSLNLLWTAFTLGEQLPAVPYYRTTSPERYKVVTAARDVVSALIPTTPMETRGKYVEEFVQLILRSSLREQALAFDPLNTYDKTTLTFTTGINQVRVPWGSVFSRMEATRYVFKSQDNKTVWHQGVLWTDRSAALLLDVAEQLIT